MGGLSVLHAFCPRKSVEQGCQVHAHELEAGSERRPRRDLRTSVGALNGGFRDTRPRAIGVPPKTSMHRRHLPSSSSSGPPWARQDDAPVWLVPPVRADQDLKANHPAVMASVATVTGIPV